MHSPTWVRGRGSSYYDAELVSLVMALEEAPGAAYQPVLGFGAAPVAVGLHRVAARSSTRRALTEAQATHDVVCRFPI